MVNEQTLRAPRANRVFCTDEKRIRAEDTVMVKAGLEGFTQDRRLCTDALFVRAQSAIRADGTPAAQSIATL
jgi:hypothetical protein